MNVIRNALIVVLSSAALGVWSGPAHAQDAVSRRDELTEAAKTAPPSEQAARWRELAQFLERDGQWLDANYAWKQAFAHSEAQGDAEGEARTALAFAEQVLSDGESGAATKASFADAEIALTKARDAGATADWVGIGLARCAAALGRVDDQIAILDATIAAQPGSTAARRARAFALYDAGRDAEAVAAFEDVTQRTLGDVLPLALTQSSAARRSGDEATALAAGQRAVSLAPQDPRGWLAVWQIYAADKRFTELADRLVALAAIYDTSAPGAHYTGFACSAAERWDDAQRWLAKAVEVSPRNVTPRLESARILRDVRHDRAAAIAEYQRVLEIAPDNDMAVAALQYIAQRISDGEGNPAGAVPLFETIAQARPDDATHQANYALALRWSGRYEDSRKAYEKAEKLAPYDAQIRNDHGLLLLVMGLDDLARARFEEAHEVDDRHNDGVENLAFMEREKGDLEAAERWFHIGWKAAMRRGEDGARHRRNLDDVRFPLPPLGK